MKIRPRRNRRSAAIREALAETTLKPTDFVLPLFVLNEPGGKEPIKSLPGHSRLGKKHILEMCRTAVKEGIPAVALFPVVKSSDKTPRAEFASQRDNFYLDVIRTIKDQLPELCVVTDVAMDPYSSDGHDGLVHDGQILNDESLPILGEMALEQARAGADYIGPSDMMDGRVGFLRSMLDQNGYTDTGIISYTAKYASHFYGPFRDALDSAPKSGDKKTYQMDPRNRKEALRELKLDIAEGADVVMVKPALAYLDIISDLARVSPVPVAAYNVSGEYAMIKAAAEKGWIKETDAAIESLIAIRRAGAKMIFTYWALDLAKHLNR